MIERAGVALKIAENYNWLLEIALDNLSLGRAEMMLAEEERTNFNTAQDYLERSVEGFRNANQQGYLPFGLLARAACYRLQKRFAKAWDDLKEVAEIADLGRMKLHKCDYHLESARLCLAIDKKEDATYHFETAKKAVKEMGYHRRDKEVEDLKLKI